MGRRSARVVAHTLSYPPARRIGAELATHALLAHLADSGWTSIAVPGQDTDARAERLDGVWRAGALLAAGVRANLVLTHIPLYSASARTVRRSRGAPLVLTAHGGPGGWLASQVRRADPALVLANSDHMRRGVERAGRPVHVLHPPVWPDEHLVGPWGQEGDGAAVTIVNGSPDKGGAVVAAMAKRLSHIPFFVIEGGYGSTHGALLRAPNVTIVPHGQMPMRDVWSRTRVLLVPSLEESWGMAAVEAMINGIPVIASTASGLAECLGPDARRIPRESLGEWERALVETYDGAGWEAGHVRSLRRSVELHPAASLRSAEHRLAELIDLEVPIMGQRYRNVRTGQVVDTQEGTRLHRRLSEMPLVWHPVSGTDTPPVSPVPGGTTATSVVDTPGHGDATETYVADTPPGLDPSYDPPGTVAPPCQSASKSEWVDYAVLRGSDRRAANEASKAALIALYG